MQQGQHPGQQAIGMPQDGMQDPSSMPQQMWQVPMQPGGETTQGDDHGSRSTQQMGGPGGPVSGGQMMPVQGAMMWGGPPQQGFQQQWDPRQGQKGQQQAPANANGGAVESSWNTSAAAFVPGGPFIPAAAAPAPVPFEERAVASNAAKAAFQFSSNAKPFEIPADPKQPAQANDERKKKGLLKNAKIEKGGTAGAPAVGQPGDDHHIALQPGATGQPVLAGQEKAVGALGRKLPGNTDQRPYGEAISSDMIVEDTPREGGAQSWGAAARQQASEANAAQQTPRGWGMQKPVQQSWGQQQQVPARAQQPASTAGKYIPPAQRAREAARLEEQKRAEEERKKKEEEEAAKPLDKSLFPTLGAAKPKKGVGKKAAEPEKTEEPEAAKDDAVEEKPEVKLAGTAWGKSAEEKRKIAAQKAAQDAEVAAKAAEAEAAKREAQTAEEKQAAEAEAAKKAAEEEESRLQAEADFAREQERVRRADEARLAEEARKAEEEKARLAREKQERAAQEERARKAEEARLAEVARKAEEAARQAEEALLAEVARKAEEEKARKAEEARLAEQARLAEKARLAEEEAKAEEERLAAEAAKALKASKAREAEEARAAAEEAEKLEKMKDEVTDQDTKEDEDEDAGEEEEEEDEDETSDDDALSKRCTSETEALSGSFRYLLAYRGLGTEVPEDIASFVAREHETAWQPPAEGGDRAEKGSEKATAPSDRSLFGSHQPKGRDRDDRRDRDRDGRRGDRRGGGGDRFEPRLTTDALGCKAENAYKRTKEEERDQLDRETELLRCSKSLLNKICPENVQTIAKRIKEEAKVSTITEMELVIGQVFKKALAEPHYCETYANMVFMLKGEMPAFPNPAGGKDVTFKSILLNVCQAEFEAMPKNLDASKEDMEKYDAEELQFRKTAQKAKFLANMKFIGQLFLQQLLTTKIVASIISELVGSPSGDMVPEEHVVECICELLMCIGYTLETMASGKECVVQVCGRLQDLKLRKKKDGKGLLSRRIQFSIQDVLDMRQGGWTKKTFKAVAKTKEEIRIEQEKDLQAQARGKTLDSAEYVVAGRRPGFMQNETPGASSKKEDDWQEIPKGKTRR